MRLATAALLLGLAGAASAQVCHTSDASGSAYDDGWQTGDNDGTGFGPWSLSLTSSDQSQNGHFIGNSTFNGNATDTNADDDVNAAGRAWGLYANSGTVSHAARSFVTPLSPGSTFSIAFDNGFLESGVVDFILSNGAGELLVAFGAVGPNPSEYLIEDGGGARSSGVAFTDEGLSIDIRLLTATYEITITRLVDEAVVSLNGTLTSPPGGQSVAGVSVHNRTTGPDPPRDLFVNSLEVCYPSLPVAACSTEAPLSFDFDGDGSPSTVMADDFNTVGTDNTTFGEFAGLRNESAETAVDLSTCSFVAFDPFTEAVTYVTGTTGIVDADGTYRLASQNGDQRFDGGDVLFDSPGAFALVEGTATVGDDVSTVFGRVVAAVVYDRDRSVFGSVGGGATVAEQEALARALAQVSAGATSTEGIDRFDLAVSARPNPVSGSGTVSFGLAEAGHVRAALYDALGREVAVLADRSFGPGPHTVGLIASGLTPGVYVVRVVTETRAQSARLTVVR